MVKYINPIGRCQIIFTNIKTEIEQEDKEKFRGRRGEGSIFFGEPKCSRGSKECHCILTYNTGKKEGSEQIFDPNGMGVIRDTQTLKDSLNKYKRLTPKNSWNFQSHIAEIVEFQDNYGNCIIWSTLIGIIILEKGISKCKIFIKIFDRIPLFYKNFLAQCLIVEVCVKNNREWVSTTTYSDYKKICIKIYNHYMKDFIQRNPETTYLIKDLNEDIRNREYFEEVMNYFPILEVKINMEFVNNPPSWEEIEEIAAKGEHEIDRRIEYQF